MSHLRHFLGGMAAGALGLYLLQELPVSRRTYTTSFAPVYPSELEKIFTEFGFPGPIHDLQYRDAFVSCYSRQHRHPLWVAEHLTVDNIKKGKGVDRRKSKFKEDPEIPALFRSLTSHYWASGYDRGHMAPAADGRRSQPTMDETFFLSNMCPQIGEGFNRNYWAYLEEFCRGLTKNFKDVYVITGAAYLPSPTEKQGDAPNAPRFEVTYPVLGNPVPSVSVPTHFYKSIMARGEDGKLYKATFLLPNAEIDDDIPLQQFHVAEGVVERATGILLWSNVSECDDLCTQTVCKVTSRR